VTRYAKAKRLNRFEVEQRVRQTAREVVGPAGSNRSSPLPDH
jgi:hypothetical protein